MDNKREGHDREDAHSGVFRDAIASVDQQQQVRIVHSSTSTSCPPAETHSLDSSGQTPNSNTLDEYPTGNALPESNHDFLQTVAGVAGNILEWYDFAVFGFFSDIIGEVFFPPQAGHSQTVESFVVFGLAFLMRPVGGAIMGYIGDVYGRKKALILSIFLMAFPTFAMGCLPSYASAGPIAIVLLVLTRMLQGMSVGGQLVSSLVYTVKSRDPSVWGLYGTFALAAANFGTLLGNLVAFVIISSAMTDEQLHAYGWRIPFWSGILVSIPGFYLRGSGIEDHSGQQAASLSTFQKNSVPITSQEEETEDVNAMEEDIEDADIQNSSGKVMTSLSANPLQMAFARKNLRALASAAMVPMVWSAGFYLSFVWMATYMKELSANPVPNSFGVNAFALLLSVCVFFPFAGKISDRCGRVRTMTSGGVSVGILGPIAVWIIGLGNSWAAFGAQMALGVSLSFWGAPMCAWLVESFAPEIRLTSVAIGYNVAQAIAGALSPAIATILADQVSANAPGWILTVLAVVSLTGLQVVAPSQKPIGSIPVEQFAPACTEDSEQYEEQQKQQLELTPTDHDLL